jgi:hypothetical protein
MTTNIHEPEVTPDMNSESAPFDPIEAIEMVISSLDLYDEAFVNHRESEEGYIWTFRYGSVKVYVQLTGKSDEDTLTVWSPILKLPVQQQPELMTKLLELNWMSTFEAQFASFNQEIVVVASRSLADLSAGEISRLITVVATIADDYDESLQTQFPAVS